MRNTFLFDDIHSEDYGVYISGTGVYNAPSRDFTLVEIPGRNGALTLDNHSFNLISHVYPAYIVPNFKSNVQGLRNALLSKRGFKKLTDTYHSDEYYKAYFEEGLTVTPTQRLNAGQLEIRFNRDPRRFLNSGDTPISVSNGDTLTNPTLFESSPIIRAYGNGSLVIGDETISVSGSPYTYVDIDCETMECYSGENSANRYVSFSSGEYVTLSPGSNAITYTGFSQVTITPHWWRL